jgi:hypothetical protein
VARALPAALLAIVALLGCAPRTGKNEPRSQDVTVGAARFRVLYWPEDRRAMRQVVRAIQTAAPRVQRFGDLVQPITITIHPTHDALESAVNRSGYGWLRAWARYQTIDMQSPRTWGWFGVRDKRLKELLTHELTHCAMYQLAGDDLTWMYKEIPIWFSEGIATVAEGAEDRRGGPEDLWRFYRETLPGSGGGVPDKAHTPRIPVALPGDPIVDPGPIYQDQSEIVYGAARHAAEFLIGRYGDKKVHRVLELMGSGMRFPAAFKEAVGITDAEFASDFRRYVVWQGWRKD